MYEDMAEYQADQEASGTHQAFAKSHFYNLLPPQLQSLVVSQTMKLEIERFEFFFHDYLTGFKANPRLVVQLMTMLRAERFYPGDVVIRAGDYSEAIYFVRQGTITVVASNGSMRLVDLQQGSFFGEYQILFQKISIFSYVATANEETTEKPFRSVFLFSIPKAEIMQ